MNVPRKRHLARRLLLGLGAFLLLSGIALTLALHSEIVFREAVRVARPFIPGELRYEALHGTLAGPVEILAPEYFIAGVRIRAERIVFDFSPLALLSGRIALDTVNATALDVTLPPPDEADTPPPRPRDVVQSLRLPVHLTVERLVVNGALLRRAEGAPLPDAEGTPLLALERLALTLAWDDARLALTRLDATGPALELSGDLALGLKSGRDSSLELDGRWQDLDFPLVGRLHGAGDADSLNLSLALTEPANLQLDTRLHDLLDTPQWQGRLTVDTLRPAAFDAQLPDVVWSGALDFDGDRDDTRVAGTVRGGWPPAEGLTADVEAHVNARRITVEKLDANIASFGTQLSLRGELNYANELSYSATGSFDHFAWPGFETFTVRDGKFEASGDASRAGIMLDATAGNAQAGALHAAGEIDFTDIRFDADLTGEALAFDFGATRIGFAQLAAHTSGMPDKYRLRADARGQVGDLPPANFRARADGDREHLVATLEELRWLDGRARGDLHVDWRDATQLDARLNGDGFALARLDPVLAGTLGGIATAQMNFGGEQPDIAVHIETLRGQVGGAPLAGEGRLRFANGRLSTPGLTIRSGDAVLELRDSATMSPDSGGFEFELDAPALGRFHPDLAGAFAAEGHFGGDFAAPDLRVTATGSNLGWRESRIASLDLETDIRAGAQDASNIRLHASGLRHSLFAADRFDFTVQGERATHRLELALATAAAGRLNLTAAGGWQDARWRGRVLALETERPALGLWRHEAGASDAVMTVGADALDVPAQCLRGPSGHVCFGPLRRDADGWRAQANLRGLPLGLLTSWLPAGLDYRGELSGDVDVRGRDDALDGKAGFALSDGGVFQDVDGSEVALLAWSAGTARTDFRGRRIVGDLDIALTDGGSIAGTGELRIPADAPAAINARLRAATDKLDLLPVLIPEVSNLRGRFRADLRVNGPLDAPRLRGEARLEDAGVRILALGTDWENVNLRLTGEGERITLAGHAESGSGHIDIELAGRDTGAGITGEAQLTGENFRAVSTPEAKIDIAPTLRLRLEKNDLYIDGNVAVPFARITPRDLSTAVQPSSDQVIVNAGQDDGARELRVHADITTRLGEDVRVEAFGLKARVTGALAVAQRPGTPAIGRGRLTIAEGEYRAYGQDLTLQRGEIIYNGQALTNPGLDIRAVRQPTPDVTVGIGVRGPLAQPVVDVFSEPAMPETEALSFLLFGRSLNEATGAEETEVSNAALALGLGGQKLLGNVGRKLGVEEIRVEQLGDREQASLVLGKYLSPDLYVSYGIGLYEAVNTFRVRYRLSSKWTLEATSGLKSGADFVYTIER